MLFKIKNVTKLGWSKITDFSKINLMLKFANFSSESESRQVIEIRQNLSDIIHIHICTYIQYT